MAEPQKTTSVPDIMLDHRLTGTAAPEASNAIPDGTVPEIGDTMEDGTIYAGVSPDTGEALYVTPQDASGTLEWKAAMKFAADLDANGHEDWRLPTKTELDVLFENRRKGALKGTFDESDGRPSGIYWSSSESSNRQDCAWMQCFYYGFQDVGYKGADTCVRPVRSELPEKSTLS